MIYDFTAIEDKWQKYWEENKTYTYTAVLSVEHDIVFEGPTIQNWLSHSEGGTIVIK